ncbi:MAG: DnaB-like helicase N-terminal domain-containing protein, partial [Megasphaera sp.]|nr:DnaB-like helicase N-terminal domain-containing protein [Megasphaera sp.]
DPDEYINAAGPEKFRDAVNDAPNVLDYMLNRALSLYDATTLEGKSSITAMVLPVVAAVDNRVLLEAFLKKLAGQLQIGEDAVRSEFNKYVAAHPEAGQQQVVISPSVSQHNAAARGTGTMAVAEENILRFLLEKPASCERISAKVDASVFADERRRRIYQIILDTYAHQGMYTLHDIQQKLTPEEAEEVARIMVLQDVPLDENVLMDYVKRFRLADLQKQYLEHSRLAAGYSRTGDARLAAELAVCKQINDEMKQWS